MKVSQVLLIEGCVNVLVTLAKAFVGVQSGSAAILADAFHSATDVVNNGLAWLAQRIADKPADASHPYGHRKFEYLAVFVLAVLLCVIAIELVVHAITGVAEPPQQTTFGIWILLGCVAASAAVSLFERYQAKRLDSKLLDADAKHTLADIGTTLVAVLAWQLSMETLPWLGTLFWLDTAAALLIAALVIYIAANLFKQTIPVLVDQAIVDENKIITEAINLPGVISIKQVRSRSTGEGDIVEIKATVSPYITTKASHHIADELEAHLAQRFNLLDVVVHIEPE
jgi:cation diffusion facilitator family transporter